jgi:HEAT repeat protein
MAPFRALFAACLVVAVAAAQAAPPPGAKLEELREWARAKVAAQEGQLKDALDKVTRLFRSTPHGSDSTAVREAVQTLGERAGVFAEKILERITAADSPDVKKHFADVLVAAGDPALAPLLLKTAQGAPTETAAILVRAAARMKHAASADDFRALIENPAAAPAVRAEAVGGLARSGAPDGPTAARKALADGEALLRRAGAESLGVVGQGRDDVEALRKAAVHDASDDVRRAALRALGRFRGDLDALRTLHEVLAGGDPAAVDAVLDALRTAGTRDLSSKPLLDAVKKLTPEGRQRAARVLMELGNPEGVKALFLNERKAADQSPEARDLQIDVADKYREYGWYEGALPYYERALSARGAQATQAQVQLGVARCNARLKRFDEARRRLRLAGYTSLKAFADDPDFAEMRELPGHRDLFK